MTSTTSGPSADTNGDPATVGGDIERLNPADGLFLRAEHLRAMEDYARELAVSVGVATGCGVVWGYHAWIENETILKVGEGLVIAPDGRPLRSRHTAVLDLSGVAGRDDGFWVVEVVPAAWLYGEENVYGNLCDDPCSTGSPIRPYQAEGVRVRLREDTMPGLSSTASARQRNWLASAFYERERERRDNWLLPDGSGAAVRSILDRDWSLPTDSPAAEANNAEAVAIAALLRIDGAWVLDVWTARRDVGERPPRRSWQERLGMRPWHIFIAQVLQFQAQLAAVFPAAKPAVFGPFPADEITEALLRMKEHYATMPVKPRWIGDGLTAFENAIPKAVGDLTLRELGIDELPAAGYLPAPPIAEDVLGYVRGLFGPSVNLRVCQCRADFVAHAVEQSQHLDRIPLDPDRQKGTPQVDILVPSQLADLAPIYAPSYPWLAFVRRRECDCDVAATESVDVFVLNAGQDDAQVIAEILKSKRPPAKSFVARLQFPVDTYAVPVPTEQARAIRDSINNETARNLTAIGLASTEDRQPLAVARAALLTMFFRASDGNAQSPELKAAWDAQVDPEKVVIVIGPSDVIVEHPNDR